MSILILIIAILISGVAGFYSITGLTTIFGGAFWSIVVMGTVLELGKVSITLWLHQHWENTRLALKIYLTSAIVVLMGITSLGTFGYLSRAHVSQNLAGASAQSQVDSIESQITVLQQDISDNQNTLKQLDVAINQVVEHGNSESGTVRALQLRNNQQKERHTIADLVQQDRTQITALREKESPFKLQLQKTQVEVGPIKYIAALIYGDNPSPELLERAVRWVIILIVMVFDPLAIAMLLAADQQLIASKKIANNTLAPITATEIKTPSVEEQIVMPLTKLQIIGKLTLPKDAPEGSLFIATDKWPSVLYKYSNKEWHEVDKNLNPEYISNSYIEDLIKNLTQGSVTPDQLTVEELKAVEQKLKDDEI